MILDKSFGAVMMEGKQMEPTILQNDTVYLADHPLSDDLYGHIVAFSPDSEQILIGRLWPQNDGLFTLTVDNPEYQAIFDLPANKLIGECIGITRIHVEAVDICENM